PPPRSLGPAVDAVAAAVRDAAQLLDVEVDQLARPLALVADHGAAGPVGVGQAAQAVAAQDAVDGRASHAQGIPEPMGALAAAPGGGPGPAGPGGRRGG